MAPAYNFKHPRFRQAGNYYQSVQIQTADGLELILILYREALSQLNLAKQHLATANTERRIAAIDRAMSMIGELQTALDFDRGKEIATSLDRLYNYSLRRLTEANVNKDPQLVDEVIQLLGTLESAWQEVSGRSST